MPEKQFLYSLMIRQLEDDGLESVARLLSDVSGIQSNPAIVEDGLFRIVSSSLDASVFDTKQEVIRGDKRSVLDTIALNGTREDAMDESGSSPAARSYVSKFTTSHKGFIRAAAISKDGSIVATASEDTSIKLLDIGRALNYEVVKGERPMDETGSLGQQNPSRPVIRTYYDHQGPINDVCFHPSRSFLASCSQDATIKFFEYSRSSTKRAFRTIRESANVRSIDFHPSGDYLLAGTADPLVRLYDCSSFQPFTSSQTSKHHFAAINQVRWSPHATVFASASKDGCIKIWDGRNFSLARSLDCAHSGRSVSSIEFSKDGRFLLSSGQDSTCRLWDVLSGHQVAVLETPTHQVYLTPVFSLLECQTPCDF